MKNLSVLFCGILALFMAAWTGFVLVPNLQFGGLPRISLDAEDSSAPFDPQPIPGIAAQGREVYQAMGCAACHTQQVRPATLQLVVQAPVLDAAGHPAGGTREVYASPDIARLWGKRGTVARDYILQPRVLLGVLRLGPDLTDVGSRADSHPASKAHFVHLYNPRLAVPGSLMPSFRFLFNVQPVGNAPSPLALTLPPTATAADLPPSGHEIVPSDRAVALVAYLRSLQLNYELPEARFPQP